ncbi:PIN/TRAM domain-containing protein [Clostridium felsineum]|uniref:PIN and TRAM-domain containing protein YacL n=1 Tax=Clostridium felsineum TaxID=36839 RepID=A0A1S8M8I2_9CLOT|nr:PIN/TRAM domain-containing protein [Clostridium felsineum]MCR3758078.1 PIN/TRAM domain-containing protein [Clostridium felsineum]URZ03408.1 putative PIN and TRAM-domain containing protein YacL [Clostridium felsineum]URZ08275.1 putative PIN and TRAM-domain containing protein YacL [Clostridium felsineum]URZ13306.1 putative PIN and TRAM-domain containing protein YacL [Clostridium felsineum]URZ14713.1 putative PIN and TRAM-domain containing protein YacL [Clostridium felsineum DSM 794]
MLKKILRGLFTVIGLVLGYLLASIILRGNYFSQLRNNDVEKIIFIVFCVLVLGIIFFIISPWINSLILKLMDYLERTIQKIPVSEVLFGTGGAIIGLIIASLLASSLNRISSGAFAYIFTIIFIIVNIIMAVFGADVAIKKREELINLFYNLRKSGVGKEKKSKGVSKGSPKILDTSVIIDGRIFDICQTDFIEGTLIIPGFVLKELRHIADSSDGLKRNRGRRGLDILNKIQKELNIEVKIYDKDFPDIQEVDLKLLKLAEVMKGKVITNDYNLNKVAEFQGVPVLNINELANAVKPVVLPGEEMTIQIIKDGKESGQGIGYLDDGTMIVVEGGRSHIGETREVTVTSVLQTAAGRMIFARQKN